MLAQGKAEINNQSPDLCHLLNKLEDCWMNIIRTTISHKSQPNFFKRDSPRQYQLNIFHLVCSILTYVHYLSYVFLAHGALRVQNA